MVEDRFAISFFLSKSTALYLMPHHLVFSWLPQRFPAVQVTIISLPSAGLTPFIITTANNESSSLSTHRAHSCFQIPTTHDAQQFHRWERHKHRKFFLLTKECGISFCLLKRQLRVWVSFTVTRSWVVIPAHWCSDKCHGHCLTDYKEPVCSYASCFTFESQKSRFW